MESTTPSSQPVNHLGAEEVRRLVVRLANLTQDLDQVWRNALSSVDFDTWNRLAEASHSAHRALNCLTLEPLVGISGCLSSAGEP